MRIPVLLAALILLMIGVGCEPQPTPELADATLAPSPSVPPAATTAVIIVPATQPLSTIAVPTPTATSILPTMVTARAVSTTDCINDSDFVDDVSIPDGTEIGMGDEFTKTWRLRNTGTCAWDANYTLTLLERTSGIFAEADSLPITTVAPNEEVEISIRLQLGPNLIPGDEQRAEFQLQSPTGEFFGTHPFVLVRVASATVGQGGGTGTISGLVWRDVCVPASTDGSQPEQGLCVDREGGTRAADGIRQREEAGITAVLVELRRASCEGTLVLQGPTASDGTYAFTRLPAGTYCVLINALNPGNAQALTPGTWTLPADLTGTVIIRLAEGDIETDVNFGWDVQE